MVLEASTELLVTIATLVLKFKFIKLINYLLKYSKFWLTISLPQNIMKKIATKYVC